MPKLTKKRKINTLGTIKNQKESKNLNKRIEDEKRKQQKVFTRGR